MKPNQIQNDSELSRWPYATLVMCTCALVHLLYTKETVDLCDRRSSVEVTMCALCKVRSHTNRAFCLVIS